MLTGENLVFVKNSEGDYQSGGYKVNSCLFGGGGMLTLQNENNGQTGGSLSALKDLAIPAGLLYLQQTIGDDAKIQGTINKQIQQEIPVIENDLYDDLLYLVSPEKRKLHDVKTRKRSGKSKKNKTRRLKN